MKITVGARSSLLSRAQVKEVEKELPPGVSFEVLWVETLGDRDQTTSLRTLGKTDFFTRDLDEMLLEGKVRAAVHSAKDLPEPLPKGLALAALTRGQDARDSLVLRSEAIAKSPRIATSSERREEAVRLLYPDARFFDLRGPIHKRLELLEKGEADGVVIAEAALIRLGLTHLKRVFLPGETVPLQGKLAILIREDDDEMRLLFWSLCDPLFRH